MPISNFEDPDSASKRSNHNISKSPWGVGGIVALGAAIATGLTYLGLQLLLLEDIKDPFFIGLLIAGTYAIYRFGKFLRWYVYKRETHFLPLLLDDYPVLGSHGLAEAIFHRLHSVVFGVLFGGVFLLATLLITPWEVYYLNISLGAFLLMANIITGMAIFSILRFFSFAQIISLNAKVSLWDRSDPAVLGLLETSRYLVLATSFAACSGTLSAIFSVFEINVAIYVFAGFSLIIVALTYTIPLYPLMVRIGQIKKENLCEVEKKIQKEYDFAIESETTADTDVNLADFYKLLELRSSILAVRTTAIAGKYSIETAVPVILLTLLPLFVDHVLKTYM
tara:strand:+ start:437 stop:1447 length:1011 start_codon:yes stop_codon:yes gene_type:complete